MRNISERALAVVIPLLSNKMRDMEAELRMLDSAVVELSEEQLDERCDLQECLEQYSIILDSLRKEYEAGLSEGINLPPYEKLVKIPNAG